LFNVNLEKRSKNHNFNDPKTAVLSVVLTAKFVQKQN